jgi:FlaA1/EpsC-like NDP-sugar epimerase
MTSTKVSTSGSKESASQVGLRRLSHFLAGLPSEFYRREGQFAIDLIAAAMSIMIAYRLRFDTGIPHSYREGMWILAMTFPVARLASILLARGYEIIWRYFSFRDAQLIALASIPPSLILLALRLLPISDRLRPPIGVIGIEYFSFLFLAGAARGLRRLTYENARRKEGRHAAIVLGPEDALPAALYQIAQHAEIHVVGLLTMATDMKGKLIQGFPVLGAPSNLAAALVQHNASLILVADAGMEELSECMSVASEFGAEIRLLPSASNVMRGDVRIAARPRPELVLAKPHAAATQLPEVIEAFRDRTVLITGAGGSIGSEISRQVAGFPVRRILLLDHDENSIFEIHQKLRAIEKVPELVQIVGDIRNREQMRYIFGTYLPDAVLHAAAFKHVPVMEVNRSQAVLNNIIGTRELANLSLEFEVDRFLMISTDKAVRPSSIMGATKRVAEILIQNRAGETHCKTKFACVRFGNVVGSRGSVIPIFLRQIAEGGPVTITHELMTRYFMTIPEAVQLVLQAATLATRGELYMLDMGDPVRIMDLARKLVESAGLRPGRDIEIKITGIREGEKLHEQLWLESANVSRTKFDRVYRVLASAPPPDLTTKVNDLEEIALRGADDDVLAALKDLPIEWRGTERVLASAEASAG